MASMKDIYAAVRFIYKYTREQHPELTASDIKDMLRDLLDGGGACQYIEDYFDKELHVK